ncbi:39S ribosomal protein L49 mitochondrial [Paragonimus heterotremus]|uniref:Large ribosomal subunit protein mL49 n=1 Tax=Paragonimus heterotremus TaxID=100268 RepID=A0A8J4SKV7_9TREM|nr:39S ribosomal protein L49 mitochondrial [Paragonimus heterotremus]
MFLQLCRAFSRTNLGYHRKFSVNIRWWPTLQNPWEERNKFKPAETELPKIEYETSKSDFDWVKKIIGNKQIPLPNEDLVAPTPSGWVPPNPELSKNYSYHVRRSKNHMLPVYYKEKHRKAAERSHGTRPLTVIRHIDGDMWALADDLRALLQPKCEGGLFLCQVDEVTRVIKIEGIFLEEVSQFLLSRGF